MFSFSAIRYNAYVSIQILLYNYSYTLLHNVFFKLGQ